MEPEFHTIPLASTQHDIEADMNELMENTLKYQTFNKNEIKYLYHNLIDNCIYFLETSFESLYSNSMKPLNHQEYRIFIEKVLREARITIPLLYSIMYYIKRFRTAIRNTPQAILGIKDGLTINESEDLKKVFVSAAVLSLKFFNDRVIMNAEWTKFIDISVEQVNLCERQFIRLINYNLNLNVKNYYVFINDYLKKFNNNNNSSSTKPFPSGRTLPLPTITTSPPFERDMKCSSIIQPPLPQPQPQPQPLAMNNNIQSVYHTPTHHHQSYPQTMDISMNNGCNTNTNTNHTNSNTNTSSSNAYLSITPTPSVGSQVTPTPSGDRLLTPIDTTSYEMNYNNNNCNTMNYNNNNNTNSFNNNFNYNNNNNTIDNNMNYNNGYNTNTNTNTNTNNTNINNNDYGYTNHCYQNQMNSSVLYCDPMSIGEQNSPQHQQYFTNTSYTSIMKTNSDSTFVSDLNHGSHHYAITSPQFYCSNSNSNMNNDNGHGIMNQENRMNVLPTPKNTYKTTMSCSSCSSECTLYQSNSMDEDGMMMQDQNNNNNRMPLNKLLYHNLHMKQNYSKDELRRISEVEEEML